MIFLSLKKSGFTLVELTVAISIVAVLATVVLGNLSAGRAKARDAQRMSDLGQLQVAFKMYRVTNDSVPPYLPDFNDTKYLSSKIMDPTGNQYIYENNATPPSCGTNKIILYSNTELSNTSNWTAVCGGTTNYDRYVVILK